MRFSDRYLLMTSKNIGFWYEFINLRIESKRMRGQDEIDPDIKKISKNK